jgi:phosphatidylglycerophosphate synthase
MATHSQWTHGGARRDGTQGLPGSSLFADTLAVLFGIFVASAMASVALKLLFSLEWRVVSVALAALAAIFALVMMSLRTHGHSRFGLANTVTAMRAALACLVGATVLLSEKLTGADNTLLVWSVVIAALMVLVMDGLDGYLARLFGQESAFGARFDMEVDALLVLILSVAAFTLDKAGWWVISAGSLRYLFVIAQRIVPRLRGELRPSFRRKAICVVQICVLCLVLIPAVDVSLTSPLAAVALLLLSYSFAADTLVLLMRRN